MCDSCQTVDTNQDKKKVLMKLVPIISEPVRCLSVDAIGLLTMSIILKFSE